MTDTGFSIFYPEERIALFVDGAHLYQCAKGLGFEIDYKRLLEVFARKGTLVRAHYYTVSGTGDDFNPMTPLIDYLSYNGWAVRTKVGKEYRNSADERRFKGSMDVDIAVGMMDIAEAVDHLVLVAGNSDFQPLLDAVQRRGKRVTVVSTIKTTPPMCYDELRRQADGFIDLEAIKPAITRAPKPSIVGKQSLKEGTANV